MTKPSIPHVPILIQVPDSLRKRKRVIVIVATDLAVWSFRETSNKDGLCNGTAVNFVVDAIRQCYRSSGLPFDFAPDYSLVDGNEAARQPKVRHRASAFSKQLEQQMEDPSELWGVLVINAGQLYYSHKFNRAMSSDSWNALFLPSAAHPPIRKDEAANQVPAHETPDRHIETVFEQIVDKADYVYKDADLYLVALPLASQTLLSFLNVNCKFGTPPAAAAGWCWLGLITTLTIRVQVRQKSQGSSLHGANLRQLTRHQRRLNPGIAHVPRGPGQVMGSLGCQSWHDPGAAG